MRVISGKCRGTSLESLPGDNTRPTLDRVKESIFNILGNVFFDTNILDLFAGSGALGLEALSRGAISCSFVDSSKDAINIINKNIKKCHFDEISYVYHYDFKMAIEKLSSKKFDFVFLDPPYGKNLGTLAIESLENIVSDNVTIVLETDSVDFVPDKINCFEKYDTRKYGRVVISFFRRAVL